MIIVHKVKTVSKHPNADSLMIYEMTNRDSVLSIVANLTNIYAVGDHVLVALPGSILKEDNLEIRQTKIRGVHSEGMALGKTDLPVGTDVSEQYCTEMPKTEGLFSTWCDIESLFNVRSNLKAQNDIKKIKYRPKCKLHGTNGGIRIMPDETLIVQSRNQVLTEQHDNCGFFKWVMSRKEYWKSLKCDVPLTIFGEFCGLGIMHGCAIHQIDKRIFAIFSVEYQNEFNKNLHFGPAFITSLIKPDNKEIFVLPFLSEEFELDYTDSEILQKQTNELNILCDKVEKCDFFVKENFNIEGCGEGFVMYPVLDDSYIINKMDFADLSFKVKGAAHKVVNVKAPAQIEPEVAANIEEFIKLFVTENRLNQFAKRVGPFDMKSTGQFIKLLVKDVLKESVAELEASKMDWKMVGGPVGNAAREWWVGKCKELS